MPPTTLTPLLQTVSAVDWDDLAAITAAADKPLPTPDDDRPLLLALAADAAANPALVGLSEHYDILDKLVLHDDPTGWRLRLHLFLPGYFDRPHNHRWTYTSRILAGSYTHTLYGTDDQLGEHATVDVAALRPRMVRTEQAGDSYTLHHSMIHAVTAEPYTTSLIVRGPAVKDRFLVTDRTTAQAWWQHGATTETPAETANKRMNANQVRAAIARLIDVGVLA